MRKKVRAASDDAALLDVRAELLVAALICTDRRFKLAFEPYGSARGGPDFAVVFREKWGYIDKAGRYVINALYDEGGIFSTGLAAVLWNGRWGYLDRSGTFVITPRFDGAQPFQNGWADVRVGTRWGRTNRLGEVFFSDNAEIGS